MDLSWDGFGSWPELNFNDQTEFGTQLDLTVDGTEDFVSLMNSVTQTKTNQLDAAFDFSDAHLTTSPSQPGPPPHRPSPSPHQTKQGQTSDLQLDIPPQTADSQPTDTPTTTPKPHPGGVPKPRRWTADEVGQLHDLVGIRDGNALKPAEWDLVAVGLGTGRTGTAARGKWQKLRDQAKAKAKPPKGRATHAGLGGTPLKQDIGKQFEPFTPTDEGVGPHDASDEVKTKSQHSLVESGDVFVPTESPVVSPAELFLPQSSPTHPCSAPAQSLVASPEDILHPFPLPQKFTTDHSHSLAERESVRELASRTIASTLASVHQPLAPNAFGLPPDFPFGPEHARPWTADEDCLLLATVILYSTRNWEKIALVMASQRTAPECKARWGLIETKAPWLLAIGSGAVRLMTHYSKPPTSDNQLGLGSLVFKLDDPLPTLGSVPGAVSNYYQLVQATSTPLEGGYVAPTNSVPTPPTRSTWDFSTPSQALVTTSQPMSPRVPAPNPQLAHSNNQAHNYSEPDSYGVVSTPNQSRRPSFVEGPLTLGHGLSAPPPSPATGGGGGMPGPGIPVRRFSFEQQQRHELATLVGAGVRVTHAPSMQRIATPRIPQMPSLGAFGSIPLGSAAPAPRAIQVRRPSVPAYVYSPGKFGADDPSGGALVGQGDGAMGASANARPTVNWSEGSGFGLQRDEAGGMGWEAASPPRQQQSGPRVRTPFGPKSTNQLSKAISWAESSLVSPVKTEKDQRPAKKWLSSGSALVAGAATKRVTRSAGEEAEQAKGEEEAELEEGEIFEQEKGPDVDAEGSVDLELRDSEEASGQVAEEGTGAGAGGTAISPRAHLKRKCTSPSFEAEKGKLKSYKEVDEVKDEDEEEE